MRPTPGLHLLELVPDLLIRDVPLYLLRLMDADPIPEHLARRYPEKQISAELADRMRAHALRGTYRGVFTTIPNEGHGTPLLTFVLRCMGMIPGVADWVFMWEGGGGWIELKRPAAAGIDPLTGKISRTPAGTLSESQRDFREWCLAAGLNHAVCYSADEAEAVLRGWGAL